MNAVIYYSCTGHGKAVAEIIAGELSLPLLELTAQSQEKLLAEKYSLAVLVFPVHCQSHPAFMKEFFMRLKTESVALIAVYGMADAGNAIYEAAKIINAKIVAAAYLPAGHSYLNDGYAPSALPAELIEKLKDPAPVYIPRRRKTPFAGVAPSARSRTLVKIVRGANCTNCNLCGISCDTGAIKCGKTNKKCVRCLRCVAACPNNALLIKKARILTNYLKKAKCKKIILYLE